MSKVSKLIRKRETKIGLPPGTAMFVGEKKTEQVRISYIDYDEAQFQEKEVGSVEECFTFKDTPNVTWINMDGIHEVEIIQKIGKHFDLHPLILEDILNTHQRPKREEFEHYIYIVMKRLYYDEEENEIKGEQVSLIVGDNYVISFQEREGDIFEPIRERIRNGKGRIRRMGADYLAYKQAHGLPEGNSSEHFST